MRILAVVPLYPPHSLVGAWITTHEHLRHLAGRGHHVEALTILATRTLDHEGVTVRSRHDLPDGDVVIAHLGDDGSGQRHAERLGVPLVYMVHGFVSDPAKLDACSLAVFNSETLRAEVGWDGPSIVAWPGVDPERYRTTPGDRVTLMNLSGDKGGELFWILAASEPSLQFLGVRGGYGRQIIRGDATNVAVLRKPVSDVREVYSQTRLLLMPGEKESWGRVALEGACSGIPTIAHPTPGLFESLGDAGIYVDRADLAGWRREVRRLHDPDEWSVASAKALERSRILTPDVSLSTVASAVEALAGVAA